MSDADHFDHWRRRLAGEEIGCRDGEPQCGYYRKGVTPVAIWMEGAELVALDGQREIIDQTRIAELWGFCHAQPITYELYVAVNERGEAWPDHHPAVVSAAQAAPPSGFDAMRERIEAMAAEADALVKAGAAKTEDESNRAAHLAQTLGGLEAQSDKDRAAEKKPHDDAAKAVQTKWRPIIDRAAEAKTALKRKVVEPFLTAKARAEAEARQKALREAQEAAAQATDADTKAQAEVALHQAERATAAPVKAATRGGRVALRSVQVTTVTDIRAALRWFADRNEDVPAIIVEAVQKLAKGFAEMGTTVPGTTTTTEQRAA